MAGRLRLARARNAVTNFRSNLTSAIQPDRTTLRAKLQKMRSGFVGDDSITMAARKGKPLSTDDEEGAIDDLAQLEAIESEDPEASKE